MATKFANVDDYIGSFPTEVGDTLEELRRRIHAVVPGSGEKISYNMPTVTLGGAPLVHFAGWKHHIALYPLPDVDEAFEQELGPYRGTNDTLRLPLDKPVPYALVERVVALLAEQRGLL